MPSLLKTFIGRLNPTSTRQSAPEIQVDLSRVLGAAERSRPVVKDVVVDDLSPSGVRPPVKPTAEATKTLVALDDLEDRAEAAAEGMTANYRAWLDSDLRRLSETWKNWQAEDTPGKTIIQQFYMAAHDLKGVARTYDYPIIADLCATICKLVPRIDTDQNRQLIGLHVDTCWAAFKDGPGESATAQSVCVALSTVVDKLTAGEAPAHHGSQQAS